jgi:hypothetical protein
VLFRVSWPEKTPTVKNALRDVRYLFFRVTLIDGIQSGASGPADNNTRKITIEAWRDGK